MRTWTGAVADGAGGVGGGVGCGPVVADQVPVGPFCVNKLPSMTTNPLTVRCVPSKK